jgi:hypothetical protein
MITTKDTKKPRGLPAKLGANITAAKDTPPPSITSPGRSDAPEVVKEEPALSKDSMRLSSLGNWLSTVRVWS